MVIGIMLIEYIKNGNVLVMDLNLDPEHVQIHSNVQQLSINNACTIYVVLVSTIVNLNNLSVTESSKMIYINQTDIN